MKSLVLRVLASGALAAASYAPSYSACPTSPLIRLSGTPQQGNQTLNTEEAAYVAARKELVPASLRTYLGSRATTIYGGSLDALNASTVPTLAIGLSGGGDRAALFAAGLLNALDGRNSTSVSSGVGGLLQTASYMSALSGGSWALTSTVFNDFPSSFYDLVLGGPSGNLTGWKLELDLFSPGGSNSSQTSTFFQNILSDIASKKLAGNWNVTFGDFWARALSYHFLPGTSVENFFDNTTDHGASILFSSIPSLSSYQDHTLPFPIVVADVLSVNDKHAPIAGDFLPIQNAVYEFNPFEFGSYDPEIGAFLPIASLGTALNSGTPVNGGPGGECVSGFDNAGWVTGTSSNLFASYNYSHQATWTLSVSPVNVAWTTINTTFFSLQPNQELDISALPNPFKGIGTFEDVAEDQLRLMDGGLDGEVDPIAPLLITKRGIDTIVLADASGDTAQYRPDGSSLVATMLRSAQLPNGTVSLPPFPSTNGTFVSLGLNQHPTFFGCAGTPSKLNGTTALSPYALVIWIPNYETAGITNTTTGQIQYPPAQTVEFLDTVATLATRGIPQANGSSDPLWPTCLACAVVERMRGKTGVDRTSTCDTCFASYCWSGSTMGTNSTTNSTTPSGGSTTTTKSGSGRLGAGLIALAGALATGVSILMG